jgi:hypothetical protein
MNKPQVFPSLPLFPDQSTIDSRRRRGKRCENRAINKERRARQTRSDEERRQEKVKLHGVKKVSLVEELSRKKLKAKIPRRKQMPLDKMLVNNSIYDASMKRLFIEPCSLCHQKFVNRHQITISRRCDHRYYITCIRNWLADVETCPLCYK